MHTRHAVTMKLAEIESNEKLKKAELQMLHQKYAAECEEKYFVVMRARRYGDAIKAYVTVMGTHGS